MKKYNDILSVVADDFHAMDALVSSSLNSKVKLVMSVSNHVINAGGKRMRPLMSLLASRICDDKSSEDAMKLAAIVEMLHTATLVHDDVIDASGMRRGLPTANATWDNPTAVLVGDYLIARSFNLLVDFKNLTLLQTFSDGTCDIAEGEVLQLQHQHNPLATEQDYLDIIFGKTSRLFMMSMEGAAILNQKEAYKAPFKDFAVHFGNAFQIIDDVMDYTSDTATMGKNIGDDIIEGKPTLPMITAMAILKDQASNYVNNHVNKSHTNENQANITESDSHQAYEMLRITVQTGKVQDIDHIVNTVIATGAIDYCRKRADEETQLAIDAIKQLPHNQYTQALMDLAAFALSRIA